MTDLLKPVEASPPETLHALVAMCGGKPLILCASKVILYDMDEIGAGRDLDDGGPPAPESDGLWVWEGRMVWRRVSGFLEPDYDEPEYKGDYRRATQEEANKLLAGEPLWPEDLVEEPEPVEPEHPGW